MAELFLLIFCAMAAVIAKQKLLSLGLWVITLGSGICMLLYHATDTLKINW